MAKQRDRAFSELESEWYGRLEASGFEDIERVKEPDRPLTRWHSFDLTSKSAQTRKLKWEAYEERLNTFTNSRDFLEIINLICKHGNNRFNEEQVVYIWEMHCKGHTERQIAAEMSASQPGIHFLLVRIRSWMKLV